MKKNLFLLVISISLFVSKYGNAQPNENKLGAWYMYFFDTTFKESQWEFTR